MCSRLSLCFLFFKEHSILKRKAQLFPLMCFSLWAVSSICGGFLENGEEMPWTLISEFPSDHQIDPLGGGSWPPWGTQKVITWPPWGAQKELHGDFMGLSTVYNLKLALQSHRERIPYGVSSHRWQTAPPPQPWRGRAVQTDPSHPARSQRWGYQHAKWRNQVCSRGNSATLKNCWEEIRPSWRLPVQSTAGVKRDFPFW